MARVEDWWLQSFALGTEEAWVKNNWYCQFGLQASDNGLRFTLEQVSAFSAISPEILLGYLNDVKEDTKLFLQDFQAENLDIVPVRVPFHPPIPPGLAEWSVGRMFRQLFAELNQHLGQVSYIRGMIKGFNSQRRYRPQGPK